MSLPAWAGNWKADLVAAAVALGFGDLAQYAAGRPASTYYQLAEELAQRAGRPFAPVQIEQELREHALQTDTIAGFARSSLVRHLRHLMARGWSATEPFPFAHAVGAWSSRLPEEYVQACRKVARALIALKPTEGWLPEGDGDRLVTAAFESAGFSASIHRTAEPDSVADPLPE
jgi:hypothetical protein